MTAEWPAGVPGLAGDHPHTDDELDKIETILDQIAGDLIGDGELARLVEKLETLPPAVFDTLQADAKAYGIPHLNRGLSRSDADWLTEQFNKHKGNHS